MANQDPNQNAKKKRRPRSAAGERNYLCGCGKAYLSYPALYTHVKNKHDGIFPIGSNAKRKIPKGAEDTETAFQQNIEKFFEDFADFVTQIPNAKPKSKGPLTPDEIERLFNLKLEGEEKELLPLKSAMRSLLPLLGDPQRLEAAKENMNIYQIFALYLASIYPFCTERFLKEYFMLVLMIIKSLNEKGELFLEKTEKRKQSARPDEPRKLFCEGMDIHIASEILNLFIAELFPALFNKLKSYDIVFEYLGFEDEHIKNLILMTKFFANWLFNNEFTDYKLEINVDL